VSAPNRTVVFDVGGYVTLTSEVSVKSNITIAGQTAPGDGIGIRGAEVSFGGQSNIICRYVRFRPGSDSRGEDNALNLYRCQTVILDHVSLAFAKWNNLGGVSDDWQAHPTTDITVQHCLIANPIGQQFGAHTECVNGQWSWFYNLFANSHNRNPLAKANTVFVNNVLYNYQGGYTTHTSTSFKHDIISNLFIMGPGSGSTDNTWFQIDKNQSIYDSGNLKDTNRDGVLNGVSTTPYWYQGPGVILRSPWSSLATEVGSLDPETAYRLVASRVGVLPRDDVDGLVISQLMTLGKGPVGTGVGTAGPDGSLYSSQTQTGLRDGGFGILSGGTPPVDTDRDGLPDYWERAVGSDPQVDDHQAPVPEGAYVPGGRAGYTLLDEYHHFLTAPRVIQGSDLTVEVDLSGHAAGLVVPPVTAHILNSSNGVASMLADGVTIQFTPSAGYVGRARLDFAITGGEGHSVTQSLAVIVSDALVPPLAPSDLRADAISSSEVRLQWKDNAANETGFRVERSTDGVIFVEIGTLDADVVTCTDRVAPAVTYHYRVIAFSLAGDSALSGHTSVMAPPGPPGVPQSLTATPANSRVDLSWEASPGASAYHLKRSTSSVGAYATIARTPGIDFADPYVLNGTTYTYRVSALNADGESVDSAPVEASPSNLTTYAAEEALYGAGAVFEDKNAGYHGVGYVNAAVELGSYLEFAGVDSGGGGMVPLRLRYALGVEASRTGLLIVNGVARRVTFSPTGSWTTWTIMELTANLEPGAQNVVRLESTGQDLANIDELVVLGAPVPTDSFAPVLRQAWVEDGRLRIVGNGGVPYGSYHVLESLGPSTAAPAWERLATNFFGNTGDFAITHTLGEESQDGLIMLQVSP
jgi:hypothetical protein